MRTLSISLELSLSKVKNEISSRFIVFVREIEISKEGKKEDF